MTETTIFKVILQVQVIKVLQGNAYVRRHDDEYDEVDVVPKERIGITYRLLRRRFALSDLQFSSFHTTSTGAGVGDVQP